MDEELRQWLAGLGLEQLNEVFAENQVALQDMPLLSDGDLKEIGIALGPRRRILKAVAEMAGAAAPGPAAAADPAAPKAEAESPETAPDAERRQLTVMFVDLVGSTELAARLDPEDMSSVIRAFQDASAGVITRYEGHIAQYLGDGILGLLRLAQGPRGRGGARRAGRRWSCWRLSPSCRPSRLWSCRSASGIATGLVVVGDLIGEGSSEQTAAIGTTPNLAARLQALAGPNGVVISETTARLAAPDFELQELGARELKGLPGATKVFGLVGERAGVSRFEARSGRSLQSMIGRDQELAFLVERWSRAQGGEGQAVLLIGEAGIGKSRISKALLDAAGLETPYTRIRHQCSPYHGDSALWPVIQHLVHAAGIHAEDTGEARLDKLEELLGQALELGVKEDLEQSAPLIAKLIGLDATARYGPLELTPRMERIKTLEVLVAQLLGLAAKKPVLMLLEDAHWIDQTTLEMLELCLQRIAAARILIVVTSRPDDQPELGHHGHLAQLNLQRLQRSAGREIVSRLGGAGLPREMVETIITRTDGIPLFMEELTKAILETGEASVPESLHDTLMARLDRYNDVKEIAQIAAVIGREFDYSLLQAVAGKSEVELQSALGKLIDAEMVFPQGQRGALRYHFKHALVRDTAYQSLLKSKRQLLHGRILEALELAFPEETEMQPDLLAHHASEAGRAAAAVGHWRRAAAQAQQKSAHHEAVGHYNKALAQLALCPEGAERDQEELDLQLGLGVASILPKSHGSQDVRLAFTRAEELCRAIDDTPRHFRALRGLWHWHSVSAYFHEAAELAERLMELAQRSGEPARRLMAHRIMGYTKLTLGEYQAGIDEFIAALDLYDPEEQDRYVLAHGEDPGLWCYAYLAWAADWMGNRDQALAWKERGCELALSLPNRYSRSFSLGLAAQLHRWRGEAAEALDCGRAALAVSEEQGIAQFGAWANIVTGWAVAAQGDHQAGLKQAADGFRDWCALGLVHVQWRHQILLADIQRMAGETEKALGYMADAEKLDIVKHPGLGIADLHIMKGNLLAEAGQLAESEATLRQAYDMAESQGARLFQLRAATGLARLLRDREERARAHDLLAASYEGFTEGFDTADLKTAKTLLEELA